jgi:subtilase family serine protease
VIDVSATGANDVTWAPADDGDGGAILYTLWYRQRGTNIAVSNATTSGLSMPLCDGVTTDSIKPNTGYAVWIVATDSKSGLTSRSPLGRFRTEAPLTPAAIRRAYGINQLFNRGFTGKGEVIGLAELGSDPILASDIANFDRIYHLSAIDLEVVNANGASAPLPPDTGHGHEIALDVEWAHAVAPDAKIIVVEDDNSAETNAADIEGLMTAADEAVNLHASVVSMSYGFDETGFDDAGVGTVPQSDTAFQRSGVTFVAASGDSFGQPRWPAVSADVLAVGGTQLSIGSDGGFGNEIAWQNVSLSSSVSTKGSGSGFGQFNVQDDPSQRQTPDVSYAADGYAWYFNGALNLQGIGTSFGAPQLAALIALVDQARRQKGLPSLSSDIASDSSTNVLLALNKAAASFFHDNSATPHEIASQGGSIETGLGTPTAALMKYLIEYH